MCVVACVCVRTHSQQLIHKTYYCNLGQWAPSYFLGPPDCNCAVGSYALPSICLSDYTLRKKSCQQMKKVLLL